MGILNRRAVYDRTRILEAAARARARKQRKKAITLYRRVLAVERNNAELHLKLAPLLAETGQHFDAWVGFQHAAQAGHRQGFPDRALAVYREASVFLPREYRVWQAIAGLQQKRGQVGEAVETLIEGSRQFRSRWLWPQAIHLLRRARQLDPWNFAANLDLARLLARSDQRDEAVLLLQGLASRSSGERLREVRGAELALRPGPRQVWQWIQAALRPEEGPVEAAAPVVTLSRRRASPR